MTADLVLTGMTANAYRSIIGYLEVQEQPKTIAEIARVTGWHRKTVRKYIALLQAGGAIDMSRDENMSFVYQLKPRQQFVLTTPEALDIDPMIREIFDQIVDEQA